MGFKDYLGRKLVMDKKTFKDHTQGHYLNENEKRHQLFPHIKETLKNPDEVWLNYYDNNSFKTSYVKFYKDNALIIKTDIPKNKNYLNIDTWFNLKVKDSEIRKGLLINKRKDL